MFSATTRKRMPKRHRRHTAKSRARRHKGRGEARLAVHAWRTASIDLIETIERLEAVYVKGKA